ncbi:hypothetical protein KR222_007611 [Zaprionus bogoriensis]|nr:hypothetical protein KR222_007611 [Zaprionus bogoriensis]
MQFLVLCTLLVALCAALVGIPRALASPSRDSGGNSWRGSGGGSQPKSRPFIYDAPIRRPGQPTTMYA